MITILFILGMFFAPRITLGYTLISLGHPNLGIVAICLGILKAFDNE